MEHRVIQLDEQTWQIEESDELLSVCMYLLVGERSAILIDTGMGFIDVASIVQTLTSKPVEVLLTHAHADHIGGTAPFEKVYLHEAELASYRKYNEDPGKMGQLELQPAKTDVITIRDGQVFDLHGRTLRVIQTPGHSSGSICVLDVERQWLFTGDTCTKGEILLIDETASAASFKKSMQKLITLKDLYQTIWSAHNSAPVAPGIVWQCLEAADLLLSGQAKGEPTLSIFGSNLRLDYKDVAIAYLDGRIFGLQ